MLEPAISRSLASINGPSRTASRLRTSHTLPHPRNRSEPAGITSSFFGTQPRMTQVPPSRYSSARATCAPCPAAIRAARTRLSYRRLRTGRSRTWSCLAPVIWIGARRGRSLPENVRTQGTRPGLAKLNGTYPTESKPLLALVLRLEHLQTVMSGDDRGVGEAEE